MKNKLDLDATLIGNKAQFISCHVKILLLFFLLL